MVKEKKNKLDIQKNNLKTREIYLLKKIKIKKIFQIIITKVKIIEWIY